MKTGFFDRVTLCQSCGAPLQAPEAQIAVRCGKCGVENQVGVRVDDAIAEGWSEDELARLAHLRSQDRGFAPDPSIAPLVAGMRLSRAHAEQGFATWQQLRARQRPGDVAAERAFTQLTLLLAGAAAEASDPYRERGLLETSLGLTRAPRHTQMLRASLAMLAARMGDTRGAESWLQLCHPRSADLRSDSYYRCARALIDTADGRLQRVLSVLGGNDVEVPVADELLGACALLRANAWERLGRTRTAVDLLVHYKFEGDPFGQQLGRSFRAVHARLDLCPGAEREAERQRQLSLGRRRVDWTAGMFVVLGLAFYFFLSALGMGAYGFYSLLQLNGEHLVLSLLFALILLFVASLFGVLLLPALRRTKSQRALLAFGEVAPARLLPGAEIISSGPAFTHFSARIWIAPDGAPAFEKDTTIGSSPERHAELVAGRAFTVRYLGTDYLIEPALR